MKTRTDLKKLYRDRDKLSSDIQSLTEKYIEELGDDRGIYITDHAIVRYLERVEGIVFDESLTEREKLKGFGYIGNIRLVMLTLAEDRELLRNRKSFLFKDGYGYVIKELTIVTVINL